MIFIIFHRPLADIFIHFNLPNAQAIYHLALWVLGLRIVSMFANGVSMNIIGALRGLYDTKFPMYLSMSVYWLLILPLAAIFAFTADLGVIGLVLGGLVGNTISTLILVKRWHHKTHAIQACGPTASDKTQQLHSKQ